MFAAGPGTITLSGGPLTLSDAALTTVAGPGAALLAVDGNQATQVLRVAPGAAAAVGGLTVTGGSVVGDTARAAGGGGVYNAGTLTLTGVSVLKNTARAVGGATAGGGGVYNAGSLTLRSCRVSGNTALADPASATLAQGGGVFSQSDLTASDCKFMQNLAYGPPSTTGLPSGATLEGGAVYCAGTLTISGSLLRLNSASGADRTQPLNSASGGAIRCGVLAMTRCVVHDNYAFAGGIPPFGLYSNAEGSASGGGVAAGTAVVIDSKITGNQAQAYSVSEPAFGGGLSCTNGTVVGSVIHNNVCQPGDGGGTSRGGGVDAVTLSVTGSTVSGNTAAAAVGRTAVTRPPRPRGAASMPGPSSSPAAPSPTTPPWVEPGAAPRTAAASTRTPSTPPTRRSPATPRRAATGTRRRATRRCPAATAATRAAAGSAASSPWPTARSAATPPTAGEAGRGTTPPSRPAPPATAPAAFGAAGRLTNSIVAGNTGTTVADVGGAADPKSSNNLIGQGGGLADGVHGNKVGVTDPMLGPLADNGGPTRTMLPLPGSPAVDAGSDALVPSGVSTDQRGFSRVYHGTVDVGAVEVQPVARISGAVFDDANGNGVRDAGEGGLSGWRVYLDANTDGLFEPGEPSVLTDPSGDWAFTNLRPGSYTVRVVPMDGFLQTTPAGGFFQFGVGPGSVRNGNLFGEEPIAAHG